MTNMLTAVARGGEGIEGIALRSVPIPVAGPGEALVRLKAATLNFRDLIIARGMMAGLAKEPDYVPCPARPAKRSRSARAYRM
ncbi:hypothetical protein ACFSUK_22545 [Sphingobium scionense]